MISIVIPLYNKENSIVNTIGCVKNQTFTDFECIIVNDGSTDNSEQNAIRTIGTDKRFVVVNQENRGGYRQHEIREFEWRSMSI